jgi:hypothetical protein
MPATNLLRLSTMQTMLLIGLMQLIMPVPALGKDTANKQNVVTQLTAAAPSHQVG